MRPSTCYFPPRPDRKLPLLAVLVVPFVLQVVTAVGLAGYLSYRNGQQVVDNLASQLAAEAGNRIEQSLAHDLHTPAEITRSHAVAVRLGILNWRDRSSLERYFEQQLKIFDGVDSVAIVDERKNLLAVERQHNGSIALRVQKQVSNDVLNQYLSGTANERNQPSNRAYSNRYEQLALSPWHLGVESDEKPPWYLAEGLTSDDQPVLRAVNVQPLYDRSNGFQGVVTSSVSLSKWGRALESLKIAKTGQAFVIEQNGLLVASSSGEQPFRQYRPLKEPARERSKTLPAAIEQAPTIAYRRLSAVGSRDFLTEQAALSLLKRFGSFDRIQGLQQFSFEADHKQYFVHVHPLDRDQLLNGLAVVIVPEADFIEAINGNNRLTLWLCAGTLAAAIIFGWLTSSWIARPILRLSRASRDLALGGWHQPVDHESRVAELEVLAHSFNQMSVHLQKSFDQVKIALQESEAKFTKVFRASPDAITIATLPERRYLDVNDRFVEFTGYTREEAIGQTALSLRLIVQSEQVAAFEHLLQTQNRVRDAEVDYHNKQGELRTVLVSSEVIELEGQTCLLSIYRDITLRKQLETALQRSEAKLNDVLNSAIASITSLRIFPDGTYYYDYWSKGCETLFGYTPDELMADQTLWLANVLPEDLEHISVVSPTKLSEQQTLTTQYRFRHKDGTLRWISGYVTSRWDDALHCWIATAVDVDVSVAKRIEAEHKQAELALRRSEATLREAQRVAHIGSWEYDAIAQTTLWSEELFQIHGLDPHLALPSPTEMLRFVHPDDLAAFEALKKQAIAAGESYERDLRIIRPDGSMRHVEVRGMPIFDDQEQYVRMVGTTLDITERKQAEEALYQSEQCFRNAFETTAVNMCLAAPTGHFLQVNASFCQTLGYTEAELLTLTFSDVTHPDDVDATLVCAQKLLAGDISYYHLKKRYQQKNGRTIWCLLSVSLVRDCERKPLYFVAQIQNMAQ